MTGFGVLPDVVAGHAQDVGELAGRVQRAVDAGRTTQAMDDEAYGLIGRLFAAEARSAVDSALQTLTCTADTGHAMAAGLTATADGYRQVEQANTGMLGGGR